MDFSNYESMDPFMLLSIINLKLRDFYNSLDMLCEDLNIDKKRLECILKNSGFEYNSTLNQFK